MAQIGNQKGIKRKGGLQITNTLQTFLKRKKIKPLEQAWPYAACYCWVLLKAATYLTSLES